MCLFYRIFVSGQVFSIKMILKMKCCNVRDVTITDREKQIMLIYTEEKKFTKEQVQKLFLSVHWISGNYPDRLYKALMNSSTVLTVWDDEKLVGLMRVLDDTEMLAQIHYVLVHPDYQGKGIAGKMLAYIKEKYKNFMYIEAMPEDKNNVSFYTKHGFSVMENGAAIQICNYGNMQS